MHTAKGEPRVNRLENRLAHLIEKSVRGLAVIAGIAIIAMMLLTCADVFLRYFVNAPIEGSFDVTQMLMVIIVFFALGYCGWTGGHVVVDLLRDVISRRLLVALSVVVNGVGAAVMLAIVWQATLTAIDFVRTGETPMTVLIPKYPFILVTAFGALSYAAVLLFRTRWPEERERGE